MTTLLPAEAVRRARAGLAAGEPEGCIEQVLASAGAARDDARLWQWGGLLLRAADRRREALPIFERALKLLPQDASIAHGLAQLRFEAGFDAVADFERAALLAPANGEVLLGRAAALLAVGDGERAARDLEAILAREPRWVAGHVQYFRLQWLLGHPDAAPRTFDRALAAFPRDPSIWNGYLTTLQQGERWAALAEGVQKARAALGPQRWLSLLDAITLSEGGALDKADRAFDALDGTGPGEALHRVRHHLRRGQIDRALPLIEAGVAQGDTDMAPYAAIAWRMSGDPRAAWLEEQPGLVSVIDLADRLPPLGALADRLRSLHRARAQHLDQSVRGGTQTDGMLFANVDPLIEATRDAVKEAVAAHVAALPPRDAQHPTLRHRRDRAIRFAGSWSVRLSGQGHHAAHVHPAGWISSALYVALPAAEPPAGWLTIGEPQAALGLDLPPLRRIEPRPGRLVLFPSTMWHGTVPFTTGERLTVAFDIAPPGEPH